MQNLLKRSLPALCALFLVSCGGGDDDSSPPPPPPPAPSALSYPAPSVFTRGTAIAQLSPTVTGTVISYSVAPALPAGLALNTGTGVITGTPTTVTSTANYAVSANNAGGSTTASITIVVNDVAPAISYPGSSYTFTTEVPVAPIAPTTTGGAVASWSIDRALPTGLTFNTTNGQIGGTPTQAAASSGYVVTAINSGGMTTFGLNIGVQSAVFLELGHAYRINRIIHDGSRVISSDVGSSRDEARAVLWNAQSGAILASASVRAQAGCSVNACIALAGPAAVFQNTGGLEVRRSSDGSLLSQISTPTPVWWWTLSDDGSYVCVGTQADLKCWTTQGTLLFTRAGDYRTGRAFAATGELRLALGPAGNQVIEKISIPAGTSSVGTAFPGTFASWFREGSRFLTTAGTTVTVYSSDSVQQDISVLPSLTNLQGQGNWFWTATPGTLNIYAVGNSSAPSATYALDSTRHVAAGNNSLAILSDSGGEISIIDLAGASPSRADYSSALNRLSAYGASSATDWAFGTDWGALLGELSGPSQRYSYGAVRSIAGNNTRFVISTSSGQVIYFNSQSRALESEIDFAADKVELSIDGTRLAAGPGRYNALWNDRTLRVYELPSENVLAEWPSNEFEPNAIFDISMSGSGQVIGRVTVPTLRSVTQLDGTPLWSDSGISNESIRLSTNGTQIAVPTGEPAPGTGTNIYVNGALASAVAGWSPGWIDGSRLLVDRYRATPNPGVAAFDGAVIVNAAGQTLATPPLPETHAFQPVDATSIYDPGLNSILDVATGNTIWSGAVGTDLDAAGAVIGNYVVYAAAARVRIEPR